MFIFFQKKDGMTPLLKACQRRNYTMQRLLLSRGANPKHKDKLGLTALHYIAEAGDAESLKMLMAYHASIDSKDANNSTPLHFATDRGKLAAVDILVFCGANAFDKNKNGISPLKSASNPEIEKILQESELVLTGIKNGDIYIESVELEPNKTYKLQTVDVVIHTPSTFPMTSLSFICRRVRPEYCHPSLKPYRKELLISDTFEFLTSETQTKAKVIMEVPIYDHPDPYEDIYMKTDTNPTVVDSMKMDGKEVKRSRDPKTPGRLKWTCTTEIDVTHVRSFNLVAFPKKEHFQVGNSEKELSSSVDKFIKISIEQNTFTSPTGKVSLEIIPAPVYTPDYINSVMSVGHFYDLSHNKQEQPRKTVNLRVPLPQDYEADGDLYLLGATLDGDYYLDTEDDSEEDVKHWDVISVNPKVTKGCVSIPVEHFSIFVASEAKKNKAKKDILSETSHLCRRSSMKRQLCVFLVLVKPVTEDIFKIIVECTTKRKKDDRMNDWINKNYLDQKPSQTGEMETSPGTKYLLKLSGNVKTVSGFPSLRLEFHPKKQENYQQFQVTMSDPTAFNAGSIDVYEIKDQPDETEKEIGLVAVAFRLTGTPFVEDLEPTDSETFPGFTRNSLLQKLCKRMDDDDEWIKVAVLLGLSFRTVETCRTNSKMSTANKKMKVMQLWRDTSKHRIDYGVNDLVSVLHKIGREDLVQIIQEDLNVWLKNHSENPDRFYRWAENKLNGPVFHSSDNEQPTPSSDQFFVMLIDKFGKYENMNQIGLHLGLSKPETDRIFYDALLTSREHQFLGIFVAAREKTGDMFKTFVKLVESLEALSMPDAVKWVVDTTNKWLSNTEKEKNPVPWRQEIWHFLNKSTSMDDLDEENMVSTSNTNDESDKEIDEDKKKEKCESQRLESESNKAKGSNESSVDRDQNIGPDSRDEVFVNINKVSKKDLLSGSKVSVKRSESEAVDNSSVTGSKVSFRDSISDSKKPVKESENKSNDAVSVAGTKMTDEKVNIGWITGSKESLKSSISDSKASVKGSENKRADKGSVNGSKVTIKSSFSGSKVSLKVSENKIVDTKGSVSDKKVSSKDYITGSQISVRNSKNETVEKSSVTDSNASLKGSVASVTGSKLSLEGSVSESKSSLNNRVKSSSEIQTEKVQPVNAEQEKSGDKNVKVNAQIEEITHPEIILQNSDKQQNEYALNLSHKIVEDAVVLAVKEYSITSEPIVDKNQNDQDIQELRHLLHANIETRIESADPSIASSREHIISSPDFKTGHTSVTEHDKLSEETKLFKEENRGSYSKQSDSADKEQKQSFLDIINQHLPSTDNLNISST